MKPTHRSRTHRPTTRGTAATEVVTLDAFCRRVLEPFQAMMLRQGIQLHFDVDLSVVIPFGACELWAPLLTPLIDDACRAMPGGGHLDLTGVASSERIEIEVADSRSHELESDDEPTSIQRALPSASRSITMHQLRCPQGGLARTLIIPVAAATLGVVKSQADLRRAA